MKEERTITIDKKAAKIKLRYSPVNEYLNIRILKNGMKYAERLWVKDDFVITKDHEIIFEKGLKPGDKVRISYNHQNGAMPIFDDHEETEVVPAEKEKNKYDILFG